MRSLTWSRWPTSAAANGGSLTPASETSNKPNQQDRPATRTHKLDDVATTKGGVGAFVSL